MLRQWPRIAFAAVWLASLAVIVIDGRYLQAVFALLFAPVTALLMFVIVRRTASEPIEIERSPRAVVGLVVQLVLYVILTLHACNLMAVTVAPALQDAVLELTVLVQDLGVKIGIPYVAVLPIALVVAVIAGALLTGTSRRAMGFGLGHDNLRVLVVMGPLLVLGIAVSLALGSIETSNVPALVVFSLGVAIVEEIVFRACLQPQLERLLGAEGGLAVTAVLFGLFHIGVLAASLDVPVLTAAAVSITQQGVLGGLLMGISLQRTRCLLVPITIHALGNVALIPLFS